MVSKGGTPRVALVLTSVFAVMIVMSGSFEQIIALYAVLFLVYYVSAFLAVFVLRYRAPAMQRPYKALGYPLSTAIVLLGSIAFLAPQSVRSVLDGQQAVYRKMMLDLYRKY